MLIAVKAMNLSGAMQMRSCLTFTHQHMNVRWALPSTSSKLATGRACSFMCWVRCFTSKQLKEDDFDVQCIVAWEILHVAQSSVGVRRLKDEP